MHVEFTMLDMEVGIQVQKACQEEEWPGEVYDHIGEKTVV